VLNCGWLLNILPFSSVLTESWNSVVGGSLSEVVTSFNSGQVRLRESYLEVICCMK